MTEEDLDLRDLLAEDGLETDPALERRLRAALELLPYACATTPPAGLKERILEAARTGGPRRSAPLLLAVGWRGLLAAAAAVVLVVVTLDAHRLRRELALTAAATEVLQQPNIVLPFAVEATAAGGRAFGRVVLDLDAKKAAIVIHHLPPLPPEEVYRLWAELENRALVPCGDFTPDEHGRAVRQIALPVDAYTAPIARLFVTLERGEPASRPGGPRVLISS